jgi:hypothetical protein
MKKDHPCAPHTDRVRVLGLLGVGLDGTDGHRRIPRTSEVLLLGGSAETHGRLQETAVRFEEALDRRGKTLAEAEVAEVIDLLHEAREAVAG